MAGGQNMTFLVQNRDTNFGIESWGKFEKST